jgi:Lipopolysaccharide kinase (Kdo/WaaP) family.
VVYRWWRKSKAQRSYEYAMQLRNLGVGSPEPLGFCDTGSLCKIGYCYYVSRSSKLRYDFRDAVNGTQPDETKILRAIAETTARMHEGGFWHKDYSGGNILWDRVDEAGNTIDFSSTTMQTYTIAIELIDLNRMRLGKVSLELGCAAFDRLEVDTSQQRVLAEVYAQIRGFDVEACFESIVAARKARIAKG